MANRKDKGVVAHSSHPSTPPPQPAPHPTSDSAHPTSGSRPRAHKKAAPHRDERDLLIRFGQIVRAARDCRAFSQQDLATRGRLHRTHISLIESARREARLTTICAIAAALRVNPGELMPVLFPPAPSLPPSPPLPAALPAFPPPRE